MAAGITSWLSPTLLSEQAWLTYIAGDSLLGIPEHIQQAGLLSVAYYTGHDFKPATRVPARERTYWDTWGHTR